MDFIVHLCIKTFHEFLNYSVRMLLEERLLVSKYNVLQKQKYQFTLDRFVFTYHRN